MGSAAARILAAAALSLLMAVPTLYAQTPAVTAGSAPGVGFLQVVVNRKFPYPYIRAVFNQREQPFVELNDLMQAVEIGVRYDPALRSASGYLPDGTTRLVLNVDRRTIDIGIKTVPLSADEIRVVEGGLYVLWSSVPKWLPLQMRWNVQEYELQAVTEYRLPGQDRAAQEAQRKRLVAERDKARSQQLMERPVPWFDPGMVELRASSHLQNDAARQDTYTLAGVQRFIGGDLEYSVTQPVQGGVAQDYTVDFARLNYYNAERSYGVTAGQGFAAFSPLVLAPLTLQGATFFTGAQPERYGRTTLVGTARPGSKVDLYRLGVLVDFTIVPANGVYQFNNLPLGVGTTLFEIRVYTPDGRIYNEYQEISSQEDMLPQGRVASQGAAGYAAYNGTHLDVRSLETRVGLLSNVTLGGYAVNVQNYTLDFAPITDQGTVGAFLLWRPVNPLVLTAERATDSRTSAGANRVDAFFGSRIGTLELEYRAYEDGYDPPARTRATQFSQNALLNTLSQAQLTTHFLAINIALAANGQDYGLHRTATEYKAQLDRRLGQHLTVFLSEDDQTFSEPRFSNTITNIHSILASYNLDILSRIQAQASVTDNTAISSTTTTTPAAPAGSPGTIVPPPATTTTITQGTTEQITVSYVKNYVFESPWAYHATYTAISHTPEKYEIGLGYLFRNNLRLNGQADTRSGWLIQVDYTFDFAPSAKGIEVLPPNTFRSGGVEGVVYVDENGNGRHDPGEAVLPAAQVLVSGGRDVTTDEAGHFRTWGLPTQSPTTLELDPMSTDALYAPAARRPRTLVRPGEMAQVDLAVVPSNGLEGRIDHGRPQTLSPAYGTRLILEPGDGGVPYIATVEWDGAFVMEGLPPGKYRLHADPGQLQLKGIQLVPDSQEIDLPPSRDPIWKEGILFRVVPLPAPVKPNDNAAQPAPAPSR